MTKAELNKKPKSTLILMCTLRKIYKGGKAAAIKKTKAQLVNALATKTKAIKGCSKPISGVKRAKKTATKTTKQVKAYTKKAKEKLAKTYYDLKKKISGSLGRDLNHSETEIYLSVMNDYKVQNQLSSIYKNLVNKMASGKYDPKKAAKLFNYVVQAADKNYQKDFGGPGRGYILSVKERENVSKVLEQEFRDDALGGYYEHLLYKKYQK
tara:strand:- start:959 stop:1588 length:630 start_codon:yes stop_codon:yes gene_type:complete